MVGRKGKEKKCVECGKIITGFKDYCAPCHEEILLRIKITRRERKYKKRIKSNGDTK